VKEPDLTSAAERDEDSSAAKASKSEQTRTLIVETALRLFRENGYDRTTMRAIAKEAGVSVGNAYYYFASKEHLVQGFYDRMQVLHAAETARRTEGVRDFAQRLVLTELAFVDVTRPYHQFAGRFFAVAAEPTSPLNPFSTESAAARETSTDIFRDVVGGSDVRGDARVLAELPELLWLAHMGVVLHWVHDRSPDQRRTALLVRRAVPLVDRLVRLSRLRPLRPVAHEVLDLARDLRTQDPPAPSPDHGEEGGVGTTPTGWGGGGP
jgi:AcrR family transcriptional regulator